MAVPETGEALIAALRDIESLVESGRMAEANAALAPLMAQHSGYFWVRRMQARADSDPVQAMRLWHALRLDFDDEAQAHVDLATALRRFAGDDAMADAVLRAALPRFPDHLWLLDSLAVAAERRGDLHEAAQHWGDLIAHHPEHARGHAGLASALARLNPHAAPPEPPRPDATTDPHSPEAYLRTIAALRANDRRDECEAVLTEAQSALPENPDIAAEWTAEAARRRDWPETLRRARILRQLAPDAFPASLFEAEALIETGEPMPALVLLGPARRRFPGAFWLAYHEVRALNLLQQWPTAALAGRAVLERFPGEAHACTGLVDALTGLGRQAEARAVLVQAQSRFPDEPWLTVRLAWMAEARDDSVAAVAWWRRAGLPDAGPPEQRIPFARALIRTGSHAEALQLLERVEPDGAQLQLARAAQHLVRGDAAAALALWPELSHRLPLSDPGFADLTWSLAAVLEPEQAAPLFRALIDEPDRDPETGPPALARLLARQTGPIPNGLAAALPPGDPPATRAAHIVASLTGPEPDADGLSLRVITAIQSANLPVLGLLLETEANPRRAGHLRVAFRLALNRLLAAEDAFDTMPPDEIAVLLTIARVCDPDSFAYLAELARARFAAAALPNLARPVDLLGCIAHAPVPEQRAAAPAARPTLLSVAICVHGHPLSAPPRQSLAEMLRLHEHHVTVFAHLWRTTRAGPPDADAALRRLPAHLRAAMAKALTVLGPARLADLYPDLLTAPQAGAAFDPQTAMRHFAPTEGMLGDLVLEDDTATENAAHSPAWRERSKALHAHTLATRSGRSFDLLIHVAADMLPQAHPTLNWHAIAREADARGVVFADEALSLRRDTVLGMGRMILAGAPREMDRAAASFDLGEQVASGGADIFGMTPRDVHRHSLPWALHLQGIAVERLDGITALPPPPSTPEPLLPSEALGLLWRCLNARKPAPSDQALIRAAIADTTGGIAP